MILFLSLHDWLTIFKKTDDFFPIELYCRYPLFTDKNYCFLRIVKNK